MYIYNINEKQRDMKQKESIQFEGRTIEKITYINKTKPNVVRYRIKGVSGFATDSIEEAKEEVIRSKKPTRSFDFWL